MDGNRIDQLARLLAARGSRRLVAWGLAAGAAGSVLAVVGRDQWTDGNAVGSNAPCSFTDEICAVDADCCGHRISPTEYGCVNDRCQVTCIRPSEYDERTCAIDSECCGGASGVTRCVDAICCGIDGGTCENDATCCDGYACVAGRCTP